MLASKSVRQLLEAFSSPTPTPGGGSAAALAGAVAASLLAMVAGMSKTRTGAAAEREALDTTRLAVLSRMEEQPVDVVAVHLDLWTSEKIAFYKVG